MQRSIGWVLLMSLLLAGCTTVQQVQIAPVEKIAQESAEEAKTPQKERSETQLVEHNRDAQIFALSEIPPAEMQMMSAIDKLTDEAEKQQQRGNLKSAVITLERALRIEPRNPHLWNRLAQVRMLQKEFKLAGDLATRSNALTQKGAAIRHDNWLIIAKVRRIEQDYSGAEEAENRAATLQ